MEGVTTVTDAGLRAWTITKPGNVTIKISPSWST
jgi:hypothetical protein